MFSYILMGQIEEELRQKAREHKEKYEDQKAQYDKRRNIKRKKLSSGRTKKITNRY